MHTTLAPLKAAGIQMNFPCMVKCHLSIGYQFTLKISIIFTLIQMITSRMCWIEGPQKILCLLLGSKLIKNMKMLEELLIKNFLKNGSLFPIQRNGNQGKKTMLLEGCIPLLLLKEKDFTFGYSLLWSQVLHHLIICVLSMASLMTLIKMHVMLLVFLKMIKNRFIA